MAETLLTHAAAVFSELPNAEAISGKQNRKERFLNLLPVSFNRQTYLSIATGLNIPDKTAQGYIADFLSNNLIHRDKQDEYLKA